jgi:hypothetical protein
MITKEHFFGFIAGLLLAFIGTYLYVAAFTQFNLFRDFIILNINGLVGKVITLGSLLTVGLFLYLFYTKKDNWAKGVVASIIVLLVITFFI